MNRCFIQYYEETGRRVHATPKSYLSFLASFDYLLQAKSREIEESKRSLHNGDKMQKAKEDVDRMKGELKEKQKVLEVAQNESQILLEEIRASTTEAEKERSKVSEIVNQVTSQATEIDRVKVEAENELQAAQPALEAALEALNSISAKDMVSLKALRKPPDVIKRIMDTVLILRYVQLDFQKPSIASRV